MSGGAGPDVLGTGSEPADDGGQRRSGSARRLRLAAVGVLVVAVVVLAVRGGLLSAGHDDTTGAGSQRSPGGLLVLRSEGRLLVEAGDGWADGPELPDGFGGRSALVPVLGSAGRSVLVGVVDGTLFRVDPAAADDPPTPLGRGRSVVAGSGRLGGVLVQRADGRVVEVDAATGAVRDAAPFPGQPTGGGWRPLGLLTVPGAARSLLLARGGTGSAGARSGVELVLAAPTRPVQLGTQPPVRTVATVPRVLAVGTDSVLAEGSGCPGASCRVLVVAVTRDDVLLREVAPPPGSTVAGTTLPGGSASNLLVVRPSRGRSALARAVAGGAATLPVRGSAGVDPTAGLVDDLDGTAYLVTRGEVTGDGVVRAWSPGRPSRVRPAQAPPAPPSAVLVCGCG